MKNLKKVLGCLRKADQDYDLIEEGDKIAVGISGGKDSSVLLHCMRLYQMFSKKNYQIIPIYVDMGLGNDIEELKRFIKEQENLELIVYPTKILDILKLHLTDEGKLECSLCSKLRKGAIVNAAKEFGCNKVAYGHHSDDAVETLFMNMIHGGRIATFLPKVYLNNKDITLIRPLIYAYENDIIKTAAQLEIPIVVSKCPNDGNTERENIKNMLKEMYHKYNCRDNFQLMLKNKKELSIFSPKDMEEK